MDVDEIVPWRSAPVSQQAWLNMLRFQRLPQQRVVEQVYLSNRKIVGGAPIGVEARQFLLAQLGCCALGCCFLHWIRPPGMAWAIEPRLRSVKLSALAVCGNDTVSTTDCDE